MYRCKDCGSLFDRPTTFVRDDHTYDEESICPYCGSDDFSMMREQEKDNFIPLTERIK